MKPGETASVRCIVATKRDSLTVAQRRRFFPAPFRNLKNKKKTVRLPEGTYRVRASSWTFANRNHIETNTIELRITDRR